MLGFVFAIHQASRMPKSIETKILLSSPQMSLLSLILLFPISLNSLNPLTPPMSLLSPISRIDKQQRKPDTHEMEQIPDWLAPAIPLTTRQQNGAATIPVPASTTSLTPEMLSVYDVCFEALIEHMTTIGTPPRDFIKEYHRDISLGRLLLWIDKDETRIKRFKEAEKALAKILFFEILPIADAQNDPMEDIQRSKLKVDARKWAVEQLDPEKYGKKKDETPAPPVFNVTFGGIGEDPPQMLERVIDV